MESKTQHKWNISIKHKQTHKENRFVVAKEEGGYRERKDFLGANQKMQTSIYKMGKHRVLLYSTGN